MNLPTIFLRLGLGKNASAIYSALAASKKPLLIAHLATAADIDRPEAYRVLASLLDQGFVKKSRIGKRFYYSAESPRLISTAFKKLEAEVEIITEQAAKKRQKELPDHLLYFKGPAGIRAIFDDAISRTPRGQTFYRYTSERDVAAVNRYLSPTYRAERDKKKLERLVISNPVSGNTKRPRLERFIKFIPTDTDLFDQNIIQLVYADSLAFINLTTEEAFVIRDASLARFQAVIFNQLYQKLL